VKRLLFGLSFAGLLLLAQHETEKPFPGFTRVRLQLGAVRLRITNAAGEYFAPLGHLTRPDSGKRMSGDLIMGTAGDQLNAYVRDGAEIDLPHGEYTFAFRRGLEFIPVEQKVTISGERQSVAIPMQRIADFEAQGWYPGDTHMHFPDPAGVRNEMECEGLRVCSLLLLKSGYPNGKPGDGHFQNVEHFTGKPHAVSDEKYFVKVGEEFRHGLLAHLIFQDLKKIVWPVSTGQLRENGAGGFDWPLMYHATADARAQGAVVTWAHWPYPSLEAPLDIAAGHIDSLDLLTTGSPFEHHPILVGVYKMTGAKVYSLAPIDVYYHYLNCGFRLAASAGSDKMSLNPPLGSARTYVKTNGPLSYTSWVQGIKAGRTFISTGPLLTFSVNGNEAGATLQVTPGKVRIKATAKSIEPYDILEIIHNGKVIHSVKPTGPDYAAAIDTDIQLERGGWLALRAHGRKMLPFGATWWQQPVFAHTSPVYLDMPGKPAPSADAAALFLDQLDYLRKWADGANFPTAANKAEALRLIAEARRKYERLQ